MKFSVVLALLFSSAAMAVTVDLSVIPACAFTCFTSGAAAAGCSVDDIVCQCTTGRDKVTAAVTPCVLKNCSPDDQIKANNAAITICSQALGGSSGSSSTSAAATSAKASSSSGSNVTLPSSVSTGGAIANKAEMLVAGGVMAAAMFL